jgi:ribonuclease R
MKDKTGGHAGELPAQERGVARDSKGNRRAAAGASGPARGSRASGASGASSSSRTEQGSGGLLPSPVQALKASIKKAAGKTASKAGRKQGKKPRR